MTTEPRQSPPASDDSYMRIALDLARGGEGYVEPNPMVGCVIVRDGTIVGEGFHRRFGGPHAEIEALRSLSSIDQANGATVYITLEPCCHHGKTPPCAGALIDAGVERVVVAMKDPSAKVDGGGLQQVADAGIDVTVGVLQPEARQLCAPYLKRTQTGLPWVIAKWAMTIDGKVATSTGQSQWITSPIARRQVHQLRSRVDAIVTGMGTVVADNPTLNARLGSEQPRRVAVRVVFCRHRLPALESRLIQTAESVPVFLIAGSSLDDQQLATHRRAGVDAVIVDTDDPVQLVNEGLEILGQRGMTNVMLEAGPQLLASFFSADQIDECHVYIGGKLFGGDAAPGPIGGRGIDQIANAINMQVRSFAQHGSDLLAVYRRVTS